MSAPDNNDSQPHSTFSSKSDEEYDYFTSDVGTAEKKSLIDSSSVKSFAILATIFFSIIVIIASLTLIAANYWNVSYVKVHGNSMQPTFDTNDGVFIGSSNEEPEQGDIAVFRIPVSWAQFITDDNVLFVKRIVADSGDIVNFTSSGVKVNGEEVFSVSSNASECLQGDVELKLGDQDFLLLGDNHEFSIDAYSLYCSGLAAEEVIINQDNIVNYGNDLAVIDGGWSWFERLLQLDT